MSLTQILFSFEGRIRRLHFWLTRLGVGVAIVLAFMVLGGLAAVIGAAGGGENREATGQAAAIVFGAGMLLFIPLLMWIELAILVKRWHDRDKPGVMVLILFIPLVGGLWTLVECGFMDGTQGPNQYGPSPKGIGGGMAQVFA
jgi:uncharacterized membrane protein YhaH (DUF805 family)